MKAILAALALAAALVTAPLASADVPGIDPFVGTWKCSHKTGNTGEHLVIDENGVSVDTFPSLRDSPDGQIGDAPLSTVTFVLSSVTSGVAKGSVTASDNPQLAVVGAPVTAKIVNGNSIEYTWGQRQRVGLTNDNQGPC
jgi:hypothetical protein